MIRYFYMTLCVLGIVLPYSQLVPFLREHGLDLRLRPSSFLPIEYRHSLAWTLSFLPSFYGYLFLRRAAAKR